MLPSGVLVDTKDDAFKKYGLRELSGHSRKVLTLAWNKDGRRLATGAGDKAIRVWTIEPHASVAKPERADYEFKSDKSSADVVTCIEWHPEHPDVFASTSASKTDTYVRFWDARTNKPVNALALASEKNMYVSWSPDGASLVVTCSNNDLVFVDYRKMRKHRQWTFPSANVNQAGWAGHPHHITMAIDDGTIRIAPYAKLDAPLYRLTSHLGAANVFTYSRDGSYLASGGQDGIVSLWQTQHMISLRTATRPNQPVRSVSFNHDASLLAYSSEDGLLDVLTVPKFELAVGMTLKTYSDVVAWSPTHNVLAFAGEDVPVGRDAFASSVCLWAPPK